MGTGRYLILLVLVAIISAQVLMMTGRHKSLAQRLRNLNEGGDSFALLVTGLLLGSALGAAVGSVFGHAGAGAATGSGTAVLSWTAAVAWAHTRPRPPARHREEQTPP
jgi:integral membrane sensor domain MASE1